jgi:hypothetical protein
MAGKREGTFVAEIFSGVNVEHVKAVPAADGSQLGISFLPPEGEPVSIIIAHELMETMVTEIAKGAHRCQERLAAAARPARLR